MEMKVCRICGNSKPLSDFVKNSAYKSGYDTRCKDCRNAKLRKEYRTKMYNERDTNSELARYDTNILVDELRERGYIVELSIIQKCDF